MNTEIKLDGQNLRDEYPYIPSEPADFETSIEMVLQKMKNSFPRLKENCG